MSEQGWRYDRWVGHFDGTKTMLIRHLFHWRGWRIDLHRMVGTDMPACFHTHPAWAIRIVLRGGYVEEMADGSRRIWRPGRVGLVAPSLAHRIHALRNGVDSLSLWIRAPKRHAVHLVGAGWEMQRKKGEAA